MSLVKKLLILAIVGVLLAAVGWFGVTAWFAQKLKSDQISPIVPGSVIQLEDPITAPDKPYKVYGYVPYWNLLNTEPSSVLSDVSYFSLSLSSSGEIVERTNGELDMGLRRLQAESFTEWLSARAAGGQRAHITFTMLNNDDIVSFLSNTAAQQRAIQNITQVMASYPFSGVNLDVEYSASATESQRRAYATFVAAVDQALALQAAEVELTVAVFGSAATKPLLWDIKALEPSVDGFVIMAYDYHVRSSSVAGPVAPIFGKESKRWQDDIVTNLRDFLKQAPAEKLLLGVPFYGYEWTVTAAKPGAQTFPGTGATATYERVQTLLRQAETETLPSGIRNVQVRWDVDALSPYLTYESGRELQIIYYEDARSLSYKLDLVRQIGLGGIAIWAVGYEGDSTELWDVIQAKL